MIIQGLGREWEWPDSDVKCRAVVFDWAKDLEVAYRHCKGFRTVIQAGGNMGVWPWLLAKRFDRVITAEPEPECLGCLQRNVTSPKVEIHGVGFGAHHDFASIEYEAGNLGAQYIRYGGDIPVIPIDDLGVTDCDLIYLDIEGAEVDALRGASATIRASKPVVVVEDKGLSTRFGYPRGHVERMLARVGCRVVARPHRDVVLVCE